MMESCLNSKLERGEPAFIDDLKKDLLSEFGASLESQDSSFEEKEHLQVYLRIRPFTSAERDSGEARDCIIIESPDTVLLKPPSSALSARLSEKSLPQTGQHFQFSQVFGPETSQSELFDGTVKGLLRHVLEGGNSLVFTYGVTNAGKTFTFLGPDADAGLLPRSLKLIFSSIQDKVYTQMSIKPQRCREFMRLTREQQAEEALCKRNLFRQFKENEKSSASQLGSTSKASLEGSSLLGVSVAEEEAVSLDVEAHTKFSIWVSFCEIYNENIHDLLELGAPGAPRRPALRLSQDVKGNSFVKDLRWVQVKSAEEAYKVMKLGKRNQSFSSTKLNTVSSRSHSIFSIRILRIEDVGIPRVHAISELSLCDLAGSERCAKTQNKGERLKEAGNINTSLLILGKCINALRHNQQAKLLQHVPFRESKLTHYLQGFFCGRGKACMIVNINQCASTYDETLNVLKFSAVAQKVVVLKTQPVVHQKSAREVSFIINNADRKALGRRKSSLIGWERSLEDLEEGDDDDDDDNYEEESQMEDTLQESVDEEDDGDQDEEVVVGKQTYQRHMALVEQLKVQLKKEQAENILIEARVREEVCKEFSQLFSDMQTDYNERLAREKELLEQRAENRLAIFKNMVSRMASLAPNQQEQATDKSLNLHKLIESVSTDLAGIKEVAEAAHSCLGTDEPGNRDAAERQRKAEELLAEKTNELAQSIKDLELTRKTLESHEQKLSGLMDICQQKDEMISRLQTTIDCQLEEVTKDKAKREEVLRLQASCTCGKGTEEPAKSRKRLGDAPSEPEGQPPAKKDNLGGGDEEEKEFCEAQKLQELMLAVGEAARARDEAVEGLEQEQRAHKEVLAALKEEQRAREEALAALQYQTIGKEEASAYLEEEKRARQEVERALEEVRKEMSKLVEESTLRKQEARELAGRLEAVQREESTQILKLTQEVQDLKQELEKSSEVKRECDHVKKEMSELKRCLSEEDEERKRGLDQELELALAKEQLEELRKREETSQQMLEELRADLKRQEQASEQLREDLAKQTLTSDQQLEELQRQLKEQAGTSQQQLDELQLKLCECRATSDRQLDDFKRNVSRQEQISEQLRAELQEARSKAQDNAERLHSDLRAEVERLGAKIHSVEEQSQRSQDAEKEETSSQLTSLLKEKDSEMERKPAEKDDEMERKLAEKDEEMERKLAEKDEEMERKLAEKDDEMERKLAVKDEEMERKLAEKDAEMEKKLAEKEAKVSSLQKSVREAQERREDEERQEVQEARCREVERRRELLAVAEEAIAQKDAELEKKELEINRLKEAAKLDSDRLRSISLDLQRKDDDTSDLREKLSDSKKQIQQVHNEISAMRQEEKTLKQKLCDLEKSRKQLHADLAIRDRTIQQLKTEHSSHSKSEQTLQLQKASQDSEAMQCVLDQMRSALSEQEETQQQMEQILDQKLTLVQQLTAEVERLKGKLQHQDTASPASSQSDELKVAKQEAAEAQESLKLCTEKHQTDRRKWLDEKLILIGQAKESEEKRNHEMKKFAEDRERRARQQTQMDTLSTELDEKQRTMEKWRQERDTLVSALEVQLQKLIFSNAEKEKLIQELRSAKTKTPLENESVSVKDLQAALSQRDAQIICLKEQLQTSTTRGPTARKATAVCGTQTLPDESPVLANGKPLARPGNMKSACKMEARCSISSQGSASYPSVLESSEISTGNGGRASRFPKPELEISFSPLQPNRMALRRQGEENTVTVKITRSARKRKSTEMDKDEVEAENRRNTRTKITPRLKQHKKGPSPAGGHDTQSGVRSRKEGALQKIGDFLQSSPTLLGTKAKKVMGLMSGQSEDRAAGNSSSSSSLRVKKSKKKLYRPEISSPMELPSHNIITSEVEEKDSDHLIIKRQLRSRTAK